MNPFVQWRPAQVPRGAVLMNLQGVPKTFTLRRGDSAQAAFPGTAAFHFDPDEKRGIELVDFYLNVTDMIVCSQRAMEFVRAHEPAALEVLPVKLVDHSGKTVAAPHFILHPIDHPDCIDVERSKVTWSLINPAIIDIAEHLEVDPARVPEDRLIFRPKSCPAVHLMRRTFAESLVEQGFSGARFIEIK